MSKQDQVTSADMGNVCDYPRIAFDLQAHGYRYRIWAHGKVDISASELPDDAVAFVNWLPGLLEDAVARALKDAAESAPRVIPT
jgi:hypothetical protein